MPEEPKHNESFVSRWSRRKLKVAEKEAQTNQTEVGSREDLSKDANMATLNTKRVTTRDTTRTEEIIDPEQLKAEKLEALNKLTDEDMPDLETLNEESDYSGFMSTNVSEGLRKMALAKLFHGKSYNIRDGLDEYDGDYTFFEKLDPGTVTSDMHHMIEVEAKRALAKKEQEDQEKLLAEAESFEEMDEAEGFNELDEFDEFANENETDGIDVEMDHAVTADSSQTENDLEEEHKTVNTNDSNNEEVA